MASDDDVMRICLSTDNHLGYKERDPVRGMDSFAAFEEVLSFSKWKECDFLLLGGDVFHDNKPSRRTTHQTFDLLREYCLGDEPVGFQVISDQSASLVGRRGTVNYEDPNYSVGLPVFAIHGNHDDPTREGGDEALAALDLLSVTNFVNYFGKADKVDDVTIKPILMKKGATKVALYGLGNIRDERLNRMWTKQKVKFLRPSEAEGQASFFNILVLHQNRAEGRGRKNAIFESMIPEWMDVVIWGHEHECQTQFVESLHGRFRVLQPGSTVATSLVDGEAALKHLAVLELREQQFRLITYRLRNVRPFLTDEVRLDDEDYGLDPEDAKVEASIDKLLEDTVTTLVQKARAERQEFLEEGPSGPPPNRLCVMQEPNQVLVRVKVDRLGFQTLNNQRFGARFVGEVANPSDMLLFHQRRKVAEGAVEGAAGKGKSASRGSSHALAAPVGIGEDEISVEDLVQEALHQSDRKLRILKENDLKEALEEYVQKQQANAINELVANVLEDTQQKLNSNDYRTVTTAALIAEAVDDMVPTQTQGGTAPSQPQQAPQAARPATTRQPPPPVNESMQRVESEDEESDDGEARRSTSKAAAASSWKAPSPKRGAGKRARPSRAAAAEDEDSEVDDDEKDDEFHMDNEGESDDGFEDSDVEEVPPPRKRKPAPKPAPKPAAAAPAKKGAKAPAASKASAAKTTAAAKKKASTTGSQQSSRSGRLMPGWATGSQAPSDYSERSSRHAADDWA